MLLRMAPYGRNGLISAFLRRQERGRHVRLSHLPPSRCGPESRHADVNAARRAFCGELLPVCRRHGLAVAVRRHWTDGHEAVCKNLQNLFTEVSALRILPLTMHSSSLNDIYSEGISQLLRDLCSSDNRPWQSPTLQVPH